MKDEAWQNYAPSVEKVELLNQLQHKSRKGMQKTYYQETQKTNT